MAINVTIWNEGLHERANEIVRAVYPETIGGCLAEGIASNGLHIESRTLADPYQGLSPELLDSTDVLLWWGHIGHERVRDALVDRIQQRVLAGMGLVVLHSGHHSKIFKKLMGTSCNLAWREADDGERERVWCVNPAHPIAAGIPTHFELPQSEMYGEPFDIPEPDELIFVSWFQGGEVFRSGCAFRRGRGRIFYFSPGHETYPIYRDAYVVRAISNAIRWANRPRKDYQSLENHNRPVPHELDAPKQSIPLSVAASL